jgi:mRNA interferase MazF
VTVGDIHWVQLPAANGHEHRGRRPAVILQDDHYAGGLPVVLVVPLTTARGTMRFAATVLIQPTAENGLSQVSVALVFQLRAIDRRRVQERIGSIGETVLREMRAELDKLIGRTRKPVRGPSPWAGHMPKAPSGYASHANQLVGSTHSDELGGGRYYRGECQSSSDISLP